MDANVFREIAKELKFFTDLYSGEDLCSPSEARNKAFLSVALQRNLDVNELKSEYMSYVRSFKKTAPTGSVQPEFEVITFDPFAEEDAVDDMIASLRKMKIKNGSVLQQRWPTPIQAHSAQRLIKRVASALKWKAYNTKVIDCVLYIKVRKQ